MIRVQADVRGFVPKDRTVVDDRNLCSCIDPRPECFTQPCLLFEEVLKLNILMECAIDSTSEMSSPVLDFHVLDVQQLAREEGFSSYEAIDLSSDESTIVHSAADSPLLSALLDILNRKIPSLTIPSEAVTLDKSVTPIRQMLFASRVDGSGHGIQDYIGLAEDVELTTAAKAPRKSARRIDVVGKESGVINDDTRDSEAASEMIDSRDIILHQNHPNPFNPATTVEYELGEAGHVQLSVYDLSGRRVTTLVNQTQSRGHHSIVWNGTSSSGATVSSGIYFCRLRTARRTETRRMVLLR